MALSPAEKQRAYRRRLAEVVRVGRAAQAAGEAAPIPAAPERQRARVERLIAAELQRLRSDARRLAARAGRCRGEDRVALERELADAKAMMACWQAVKARLLPGAGEASA